MAKNIFKRKQSNESLIWGSILIALGLIFLIQKIYNIEILSQLWQFWPVVLIILGVSVIVGRNK